MNHTPGGLAMSPKGDRRRKLSHDEVEAIADAVAARSNSDIERIASAVAEKYMAQCQDCSAEGRERHARHHRRGDQLEKFFDHVANAKWKIGVGVAIFVLGSMSLAILVWVILHAIGLDLRRWLP